MRYTPVFQILSPDLLATWQMLFKCLENRSLWVLAQPILHQIWITLTWTELTSNSYQPAKYGELTTYVSSWHFMLNYMDDEKHQFMHLLTALLKNSHIENSKNHKRWYCPHHTNCVSMCCWIISPFVMFAVFYTRVL